MEKHWRILAKALGEKAHPDPRIADRVALVRLIILLSYLSTNAFIVAGVIRHWNTPQSKKQISHGHANASHRRTTAVARQVAASR
jgi:hypothetical protein